LYARFGTWRGPVPEVLAALTPDGILRHDLYATPALPRFVDGNLALIGDAAHAMPPDLGRGAGEALVDAVTLAGQLAEASTVDSALRGYDALRRRTVQRVVRAAAAAAALTRWTRALPVRDGLLRLALLVP